MPVKQQSFRLVSLEAMRHHVRMPSPCPIRPVLTWLPIVTAMLFGAGFGVSSVRATLLASEDFSYSDGALNGNNGGFGFTGAWGNILGYTATTGNNAVLVNNLQAQQNNAGTGAEYSFRQLAFTFPSTGTLWMSLDAVASGTTDASQLLDLYIGSATNSFSVGHNGFPDGAGNNWAIGKDGLGGPNTGESIVSGPKTAIIQFNLAAGSAGSANIWVGGAVGYVDTSVAPDATLTGLRLAGIDGLSVGRGQTSSFAYDDIRIGTTVNDVEPVPEPATWLAAGLAVGALVFHSRFCRAARA